MEYGYVKDKFFLHYGKMMYKYWKTLFYHCIDIATTNAYIHYRDSLPECEISKYDHKVFIGQLVRDLLNISSLAPPPSSPVGRPPRSSVRAEHRLAYSQEHKYCVMCKGTRNYKLTEKFCIKCEVFLCFTHDRNCFANWHNPRGTSLHYYYIDKKGLIHFSFCLLVSVPTSNSINVWWKTSCRVF